MMRGLQRRFPMATNSTPPRLTLLLLVSWSGIRKFIQYLTNPAYRVWQVYWFLSPSGRILFTTRQKLLSEVPSEHIQRGSVSFRSPNNWNHIVRPYTWSSSSWTIQLCVHHELCFRFGITISAGDLIYVFGVVDQTKSTSSEFSIMCSSSSPLLKVSGSSIKIIFAAAVVLVRDK